MTGNSSRASNNASEGAQVPGQDAASAVAPPPSLWPTLIAGPIAGLTSRFVFYPGDTIKARLQIQGSASSQRLYTGTWQAFRQVFKAEGLAGLYRGFAAVVVGNIPANMAYFGGYEMGKALVPESLGSGRDMIAGAGAQLVGGLVYTPLDIVKERMQVQSIMGGQYSYRNSWHAFTSLIAAQGPLGLLRGYWATNGVWIPWSIMHISLYEQAKRTLRQLVPDQQPPANLSTPNLGPGQPQALGGKQQQQPASGPSNSNRSGHDVAAQEAEHAAAPQQQGSSGSDPLELPPWMLGWCSAGAAAVATVLTHPADVVKTRLQVLSAGPGGRALTAVQVARTTLAQEGAKAFWTGLAARVLTIAPGSAVSWMVYEPVKRTLEDHL